jgi:hypothetical protein
MLDYEKLLEEQSIEDLDSVLAASKTAPGLTNLDQHPDMKGDDIIQTCLPFQGDSDKIYRAATTLNTFECGLIHAGPYGEVLLLCHDHYQFLLEKRKRFPGTIVREWELGEGEFTMQRGADRPKRGDLLEEGTPS